MRDSYDGGQGESQLRWFGVSRHDIIAMKSRTCDSRYGMLIGREKVCFHLAEANGAKNDFHVMIWEPNDPIYRN